MPEHARPTIVLVHGAWHGPWCWERLRPALHGDGWHTSTPRLRSVSRADTGAPAGLYDDRASLLDHLDHLDGPVVLVAHSYAGMPATEVAALRPDKIAQVIYLAAYVPLLGQNLFDIHDMPMPEDDTDTVPVPDHPIAMLYADVERSVAVAAAARLRPQSLRSWTERIENVTTHATPTTYLLCTDDHALPVSMQEVFAARTDQVVRLDSGHSPFLSQPLTLTDLIGRAVRESPGTQRAGTSAPASPRSEPPLIGRS